MKRFIFAVLTTITLVLLACLPVSATSLGVDPLFVEMGPTKTSSIKILNGGDVEVPVEIIIYERIVDEQGNQTRREADDDFIVFPPQAVIPPSSVQNVRFQAINADNSRSKSYYITVKQIPIDLGDRPDGMYINVVFAFDAAVHIVPKGSKAAPTALEARPATILLEDGTTLPAVEIHIENRGNKYLYLQDYDYEVTGTDGTGQPISHKNWTRDQIIETVPVILVTPGAKRSFKLPVPNDLTGGILTVKMSRR